MLGLNITQCIVSNTTLYSSSIGANIDIGDIDPSFIFKEIDKYFDYEISKQINEQIIEDSEQKIEEFFTCIKQLPFILSLQAGLNNINYILPIINRFLPQRLKVICNKINVTFTSALNNLYNIEKRIHNKNLKKIKIIEYQKLLKMFMDNGLIMNLQMDKKNAYLCNKYNEEMEKIDNKLKSARDKLKQEQAKFKSLDVFFERWIIQPKPEEINIFPLYKKTLVNIQKITNLSAYFSTIKDSVSDLRPFLKSFPKGGDTHSHLTGAINRDYLTLAKSKGLRFTLKFDEGKHHIKFYGKDEVNVAESRPAEEIKDLEQIFIKATTLIKGDHFFDTFSNFESIDSFLELSDYLFPLLERAYNSNVLYLEVSKGFESHFEKWDNQKLVDAYKHDFPTNQAFENNEYLDKLEDKFNMLKEGLQEEKKHYINYIAQADNVPLPEFFKKKGFKNSVFSFNNPVVIRINGDVSRVTDLFQFFADLTLSFLMVQEELVTKKNKACMLGVVISGEEFLGESLENLTAQLKMLNFLKKKPEFFDVCCSIHAGELSWKNAEEEAMGSAINQVFEYAKPDRIGHGACITHDEKFNEILQKLCCVEICPTSNKTILNVKRDAHPFELYLNNKVPVTLNTDDAGVLRTSLTEEFIIAIKWHSDIDYLTLKNLARNQLRYSFLKGDQIYEINSPYQYQLRDCFINLNEEAKAILARSPKAVLQYRLEKSFLEFEKKYASKNLDLQK